MQVADVRDRLGDDFAVQLQHDAQNAVRGGVRGPHVQDELFAHRVLNEVGHAGLRAGLSVADFEGLRGHEPDRPTHG